MAFGKKPQAQSVVELAKLQDKVVLVPIKGKTPLIPHKWSEKARKMMPGHPDSHGKVKAKEGVHKPAEEAEACVYRLSDGRPGMPVGAFKAALVGACRFYKEPSMTEAKLIIWVIGEGPNELVPFDGTPTIEEDLGRNKDGGMSLRYRTYFHDWSAWLPVAFVSSSLTEASVVALADAAGRLGVGDWRPSAPKSHNGTKGTWHLDTSKPILTDVSLTVDYVTDRLLLGTLDDLVAELSGGKRKPSRNGQVKKARRKAVTV